MIIKMSCQKEISVFLADTSQLNKMIRITINDVTKLPFLSTTFKISANCSPKLQLKEHDKQQLYVINRFSLHIHFNKIKSATSTTQPTKKTPHKKMKNKIIKSEAKFFVRLIKATCSSLFCRGARSHKECKSRKPHNKYLNKASSLSDDISTAMRCRGRNPASFSASI